jgi:hypothetical protein
LRAVNDNYGYDSECLDSNLNSEAVEQASPFDAASVFVNDVLDLSVLKALQSFDVHQDALAIIPANSYSVITKDPKGTNSGI